MDFVARLINEGYCEEDIGDILESLYLIEKNGGGSVIMEEQEYIVEVGGFLARQLAKLRGLPQTPAIRKQIKRLERLIKGGKDKVDDVAKKGDDVAGKVVKKADDAVDATKPPTASSPTRTRPSGAPVRQAGQTPTGKPAPKPKSKPDVTPVKPTPKPKSSNKLPGWAATAGLAGLGALGYNTLTGGGKDSGSDSDSDSSTSTSSTSTTPTETKPKDPTAGLPKAPFWWSSLKPKTLGYQQGPSNISSYRNVRGSKNEAYEIVLEYLIDGGHANTIEEANYIMMQMEFEHFIDIVEGK